MLRISENIMYLRKQKGITQDELASFLGVTKASVSKWENGQSMPDIILLPEIATYFDITVDELLGYEPQLSKEQIQKVYRELGENFAQLPFEEAFAKSEALVKKYYSCYLFLLQICVLWLNHYMLAEEKERQEEILDKLQKLCNHILENCTNAEICSDVLGVRASVDLLCGRPQEAIDGISNLLNPNRVLNQSEGLLIQAYLMNGDLEKADSFTQASMYLHLLMLVADSTYFLSMNMQEKAICDETITRVDTLITTYCLDELNPNVVAGYQYQTAIYKIIVGEKEEAVRRLRKYAETVCLMMKNGMLHGDAYFYKMDSWFEELDLGTQMPRSKKLVMQSARENLKNPAFDGLRELAEFMKVEHLLAEI
ncbi:MAG: helix-turn-helix domain-containing protein [Lachnospiraceae bacterium]